MASETDAARALRFFCAGHGGKIACPMAIVNDMQPGRHGRARPYGGLVSLPGSSRWPWRLVSDYPFGRLVFDYPSGASRSQLFAAAIRGVGTTACAATTGARTEREGEERSTTCRNRVRPPLERKAALSPAAARPTHAACRAEKLADYSPRLLSNKLPNVTAARPCCDLRADDTYGYDATAGSSVFRGKTRTDTRSGRHSPALTMKRKICQPL